MEREQLDRLIRTPHSVERRDMPALRELSERAPWFAGVQLLRMVGERALGDVRSDGSLQRAAALIPSRAVLHGLVERPRPVAEERGPAPALDNLRDDHALSATPEPVTTVPPAPTPAATGGSIAGAEAALEGTSVSTGAPERSVAADDADDAVSKDDGPTVAGMPAGDDPLERQILESALASIYDLTLHTPGSGMKGPGGDAPPPATAPSGASPPVEGMPSVTVPLPAAEPPKPLALPANGRLRFTSWLTQEVGAAITPSPGPSDTTATGPTKAIAGGGDTERREPPRSPMDAGALIDRFIQQETPPPTRKATFFTPQQAARKSLDDSAGMVTETLARIYAKQGNLQKAIDAYRKLALKYPEKSAYFATLSRSLEEDLNT